ncbi:MAG: xanthine dehydrogenase small subunit, partial [Pseudomonadota bacterium]
GSRAIALEDFFLQYGRQDRKPGEFVTGLFVPRLSANQAFRCYKISKRFDQDISSVMGAFRFTVEEGHIVASRIAYGGMAGTPMRASNAEKALSGAELDDPSTWGDAMQALHSDFDPLTDMRASAGYRMETARALLAKALMEVSGTAPGDIRISSRRGAGNDRAA